MQPLHRRLLRLALTDWTLLQHCTKGRWSLVPTRPRRSGRPAVCLLWPAVQLRLQLRRELMLHRRRQLQVRQQSEWLQWPQLHHARPRHGRPRHAEPGHGGPASEPGGASDNASTSPSADCTTARRGPNRGA